MTDNGNTVLDATMVVTVKSLARVLIGIGALKKVEFDGHRDGDTQQHRWIVDADKLQKLLDESVA